MRKNSFAAACKTRRRLICKSRWPICFYPQEKKKIRRSIDNHGPLKSHSRLVVIDKMTVFAAEVVRFTRTFSKNLQENIRNPYHQNTVLCNFGRWRFPQKLRFTSSGCGEKTPPLKSFEAWLKRVNFMHHYGRRGKFALACLRSDG